MEPCEDDERLVRLVEGTPRQLRRWSGVGDVFENEDVAPLALAGHLEELADHPVDAAEREVVEHEQQRTSDPRCRVGVHFAVEVLRQRQTQRRPQRLVHHDLALVHLHPVADCEVLVDLGRHLDDDRGGQAGGAGRICVPGEVAAVDLAHEADIGADVFTSDRRDGRARIEARR